jgi:hypothetical protein
MPELDPLPNPLKVEVVSGLAIELTDEQLQRLSRVVFDQGRVDHVGGYVSQHDGSRHKLSKVHFTLAAEADVDLGESNLTGVGGISFSQPVYIYLEDEMGTFTGCQNAKGIIQSAWHYGVIFTDDAGDGWFAGRTTIEESELGLDAPILRRISRSGFMEAESFDLFKLAETNAMEGEFYLTTEKLATVTEVPWWSSYADPNGSNDPEPSQEFHDSVIRQEGVMTGLRARAKWLKTTTTPKASNKIENMAGVPAGSHVEVDGSTFKNEGLQVKIHTMAGKPVGDLFSLVSKDTVMPQYFCRLEDGSLRNMNNDNYSIYEADDEEPSTGFKM